MSEQEAMTKGVDLEYLIDAYKALNMDNWFFSAFFEKLIGVGYVRKMIMEGRTAEQIRACWEEDVKLFKEQRRKYLLYEE